MNKYSSGVLCVVRAPSQVHNLDSGYGILDSHSAGRIRIGTRQAAIPGAGSHRNRGRGVAANFARNIQGRAAADGAVNTVVSHGNRALDNCDVLASLFADYPLQ